MPVTGGSSGSGGSGPQGPAGESAYQVAVDNGFTGTQADWLVSLIGPQGPQGVPGSSGGGSGSGIAVDAPPHPLAYRVAGTRGGNLSAAALSDGTVTGSNTHRLVNFPYGCSRIGIVVGNFYCNTGPEGPRDNRGPNSVSVRVGVGGPNGSDVPSPARAALHYQQDAGTAKYLDGDQTTYIVPPADCVVFDSGQSVGAGSQMYVNVYAFVTSGQFFPVHTTLNAGSEKATMTAGETDKSLSTPTALGQNTQFGFDFLAVVDLDKLNSGTPWQACLVGGDSLNGGNYGTARALLNGDVPYTMVARGMEQAKEWVSFDSKTTYRRAEVSRPLTTFAYWQILTNDADLSDGETFSGTGQTSWQQKQRDVVAWLRRRHINRVAWATLPPETSSLDSWATTAGQYLNMATRGPRQGLMQQWNTYLRSGTLLYTDPASGLRLYSPPSGQGFGAGSVIADVWTPLTVMEAVNTSVVTSGTSGYDYGGQPIMKWATDLGAPTGDGLHDTLSPGYTRHSATVRATLQYMAVNG